MTERLSDDELAAIGERVEAATAEVDRIAGGGRWRMRVPADLDNDSDLVISAALADVPRLLADLRDARAAEAGMAVAYENARTAQVGRTGARGGGVGMADSPSRGACLDCKRRYGDEYGFPDLVVSDRAWELINPGSNGAGLLCPSCMCARAHAAGVTGIVARATFTSGPFSA